jgi:hypothetical protein
LFCPTNPAQIHKLYFSRNHFTNCKNACHHITERRSNKKTLVRLYIILHY